MSQGSPEQWAILAEHWAEMGADFRDEFMRREPAIYFTVARMVRRHQAAAGEDRWSMARRYLELLRGTNPSEAVLKAIDAEEERLRQT